MPDPDDRSAPRPDRVVVITGASSGIGAATALALAPTSRLVLAGREVARLAAVARECRARHPGPGSGVVTWVGDLIRDEGPSSLAVAARQAHGGVDVLINNAGSWAQAALPSLSAASADALWRINCLAPLLLTQALLPELTRSRGRIINISSLAASAAFSGTSAYAASKAALEAWTRVVREELRPLGIRVGIVIPGRTDTPIWPADAAIDRSLMATPEAVAAAIAGVVGSGTGGFIEHLVLLGPGG